MKKTLLFGSLFLGTALLSLFSCVKPDEPTPLPTPPGDIQITADSTTLSLSWKVDPNATSYVAELRDAALKITTKTSDKPSVVFDGLESETKYDVRVGSAAMGAETKFSQWQSVETLARRVAKKFASGAGTDLDPYIIKTASQLALLAKLTNDEVEGYIGMDVYYQLGADIDLGDQLWDPIGNGLKTDFGISPIAPKPAFTSRFNGKNFTISKLNVVANHTDKLHVWVGLFGANRGNIANVNVKGKISAVNSMEDANAAVLAGGVCGFNAIVTTDGVIPTSGTGMVLSSSFEGSVESLITAPGASAMSGGIVGVITSGNVDNCKVIIPSGAQILAKGYGSISAGGVCGYLSAGRIDDNEATIDGSVLAQVVKIGEEEGVASAHAGGVCGSMQTSTLTTQNYGFGLCSAVINGAVEATVEDGITSAVSAAAGGLAGSVFDTMCGEGEVENNGTIKAIATGAASVGGLIANLNEGRVLVCDVVNNGTLTVSTTGTANQYTTFLGGIVGSCGQKVNINECEFTNKGKMISKAGAAGFTGGISASSGIHLLNSAIFEKTSSLDLTAVKDAAFGGIVGNGTASTITVCTSLIDGKIVMNTPTMLLYGGITGNFGPLANKICRSSCAVNIAEVVVEGAPAKTSIGAIYGRTSAKGISNNCYWWSGTTSITQADGSNPSKPGAFPIASYDEAGFTAAQTALNDDVATLDPPVSLRFNYDSTLGYLGLVTM